MWKIFEEPKRTQVTIWCISIACWIINATNTHSEYVILIAFPLQEQLHERTSVLRYKQIFFLVQNLLILIYLFVILLPT